MISNIVERVQMIRSGIFDYFCPAISIGISKVTETCKYIIESHIYDQFAVCVCYTA